MGGRGKAVSVSRLGDELRVWDLEGGGLGVKRRDRERERATGATGAGSVSVRVQPQPRALKAVSPSEDDEEGEDFIASDAYSSAMTRGEGLKEALSRCLDDEPAVSRGWVGFDDRNVVVLREKAEGKQTLVVYDFA